MDMERIADSIQQAGAILSSHIMSKAQAKEEEGRLIERLKKVGELDMQQKEKWRENQANYQTKLAGAFGDPALMKAYESPGAGAKGSNTLIIQTLGNKVAGGQQLTEEEEIALDASLGDYPYVRMTLTAAKKENERWQQNFDQEQGKIDTAKAHYEGMLERIKRASQLNPIELKKTQADISTQAMEVMTDPFFINLQERMDKGKVKKGSAEHVRYLGYMENYDRLMSMSDDLERQYEIEIEGIDVNARDQALLEQYFEQIRQDRLAEGKQKRESIVKYDEPTKVRGVPSLFDHVAEKYVEKKKVIKAKKYAQQLVDKGTADVPEEDMGWFKKFIQDLLEETGFRDEE